MSENLKETLDIAEEMTYEQILNQLYKARKIPFTTEISNPTATTSLEVLAKFMEDFTGIGDLLTLWDKKDKVNLIAYKRKRATETVQAISARREELDRKKDMQETLLGK